MGVQRYTLPSGAVRYRARVKSHGRYVATRVFERKVDAVAWEQDQRRRLPLGEWTDPRRGQVPLSLVAADWLASRNSVKRRTRESDEAAWRNYIEPRFGNWPVASITAAEVSGWIGSLVARGLAPSTATRAWLRYGPCWPSRWPMPGCSTTWQRTCASRPVAACAAKAGR
jgi:Phage integrase, N-terminal SAM-like domain